MTTTVRRTTYRRALTLALVGALGLATPALAADLDDIRDRMDRVEQQRERAEEERRASEEREAGLGEDLEHTSAELVEADRRLRETTAQVEQARVVLQEAELDLADAEAQAQRIDTELGLARADEAQIEQALQSNAAAQEESRAAVGAIARESYKQGGMGSLATTLEVLSGEQGAADRMSMARTVIRVQDDQIQALATQEAQQVAEQDRLGGVRADIAYLLARAEAVVVQKETARTAAEEAKSTLEGLEAQQAADKAELEAEKARVERDLAAEQAVSDDLQDRLAELAREKHGLEVAEREELDRIAAEEARRRAEEEARRKAAEEAARQRAAEEAARQRAAEREAERQRQAEIDAQRRRDEEAAAEARRRQEAAEQEAAAARAAQEQASRDAERGAREQAPPSAAPQPTPVAPAQPEPEPASGVLSYPVDAPTTSEFGNRLHPVLGIWRLHAGLDFGAGCGTPVRAAADGVVFTAGYDSGGGNHVVVDHGVHRGADLTTTYLHFQEAALVSAGQSVSRGQVIGYVGTTGTSTACHLHFETRENGAPVDPRGWL